MLNLYSKLRPLNAEKNEKWEGEKSEVHDGYFLVCDVLLT